MSDTDETPAVRGQLRRADKIMSEEEIGEFLTSASSGHVATVGADGYPYVMPTLFVWHHGCVFLHTAQHAGHFLRNVSHEERVCFEVDEPGVVFPYGPVECDTTISYRSVILFGRIRIIADEPGKTEFFSAVMRKYAPVDSWGRERGSFPRLEATIVYAITPELMTGKRGLLPAVANRWPNRKAT